jgi:hypothetical protein
VPTNKLADGRSKAINISSRNSATRVNFQRIEAWNQTRVRQNCRCRRSENEHRRTQQSARHEAENNLLTEPSKRFAEHTIRGNQRQQEHAPQAQKAPSFQFQQAKRIMAAGKEEGGRGKRGIPAAAPILAGLGDPRRAATTVEEWREWAAPAPRRTFYKVVDGGRPAGCSEHSTALSIYYLCICTFFSKSEF